MTGPYTVEASRTVLFDTHPRTGFTRRTRSWSWYLRDNNGHVVSFNNGYETKREALAAGQQAADIRGDQ